jgi:hypothetical protein
MRDYGNLKAEMPNVKTGVLTAAILSAALSLCGQEPKQEPNTAPKAEAPRAEGIPPRAAPTDYQFHAQAGQLTIAAEFTGHSVATPESTLNTEDYVVIEAAIYGPPGTHIKISHEDFTLRVNGKKKAPLQGQPYGAVVRTLKDPELEPTVEETKSKTSVSTGGGGGGGNEPPPPYRVPDALRHEYSQRLQKLSLPEGDRALPQAGLIYFVYRGRTDKLQSIELTYSGPAGQATLSLQ